MNVAQELKPPQWWLISNETVDRLKQLLEDLPDSEDATHELLTGLWVSNVAPEDSDESK